MWQSSPRPSSRQTQIVGSSRSSTTPASAGSDAGSSDLSFVLQVRRRPNEPSATSPHRGGLATRAASAQSAAPSSRVAAPASVRSGSASSASPSRAVEAEPAAGRGKPTLTELIALTSTARLGSSPRQSRAISSTFTVEVQFGSSDWNRLTVPRDANIMYIKALLRSEFAELNSGKRFEIGIENDPPLSSALQQSSRLLDHLPGSAVPGVVRIRIYLPEEIRTSTPKKHSIIRGASSSATPIPPLNLSTHSSLSSSPSSSSPPSASSSSPPSASSSSPPSASSSSPPSASSSSPPSASLLSTSPSSSVSSSPPSPSALSSSSNSPAVQSAVSPRGSDSAARPSPSSPAAEIAARSSPRSAPSFSQASISRSRSPTINSLAPRLFRTFSTLRMNSSDSAPPDVVRSCLGHSFAAVNPPPKGAQCAICASQHFRFRTSLCCQRCMLIVHSKCFEQFESTAAPIPPCSADSGDAPSASPAPHSEGIAREPSTLNWSRSKPIDYPILDLSQIVASFSLTPSSSTQSSTQSSIQSSTQSTSLDSLSSLQSSTPSSPLHSSSSASSLHSSAGATADSADSPRGAVSVDGSDRAADEGQLSLAECEGVYCRRKFAQLIELYRQQFSHATDLPCLADVRFGPTPAKLEDGKIRTRFYFSVDWASTLLLPLSCTVAEAIEQACGIFRKRNRAAVPLQPTDYVVKLLGQEVYVNDPTLPLRSLYYVRECFAKKIDCCFHLVPAKGVFVPSPQHVHHTQRTIRDLISMDDSQLNFPTRVMTVLPAAQVPHPLEIRIIQANLGANDLSSPASTTTATTTTSSSTTITASMAASQQQQAPQASGLSSSSAAAAAASSSLSSAAGPSTLLYFVELLLVFSGQPLCRPVYTAATADRAWNQWLRTLLPICDVPRETRLALTLYEVSGRRAARTIVDPSTLGKDSVRPVAWVHVNVATFCGLLQQGTLELGMWTGPPNPIGACIPNLDKTTASVQIEFFRPPHPIAWLDGDGASACAGGGEPPTPGEQELDALCAVLSADSLAPLTARQRDTIWNFRYWCMATHPLSLAKVLSCLQWADRVSADEARQLVASWPTIDPFLAMELLGFGFQDSRVRRFAVACLCEFSDGEFSTVLLQLVQLLKHEQFHASTLACFLVLAAARSTVTAQQLYWYFEAELHLPNTFVRFKHLKKALLQAVSPELRARLLRQSSLVRALNGIALEIKAAEKSQRPAALQRLLLAKRPSGDCGVPIAPSTLTRELDIDGCKVMHSFTVPLWLKFPNADPLGAPLLTIFKVGDDLRQDILTLQLLDVMDRLWKDNGLDLHVIPYKCLATGNCQGMVEVVQNSQTLADIHKKEGGGAIGALKEKVLASWLAQENPTPHEYERAVNLFTLSLAGYSVATYVLGIGDRHSDNLMITRQGNLFHIDFAHFLGNTLKFAGIDRETTPFVLTPDFVYVIGGDRKDKSPNFQYFADVATEAYMIVRASGNRFVVLLELMLSTGIPQLTSVQDIQYLRESLKLADTDDVAEAHFRRQIERSLHNKRSVWMNFWHVVANPE